MGRGRCWLKKEKKTLLIPFDCKDRLETDMPLGGVSDAASLVPGKMVLRSMIVDRFVRSNKLVRKYIVPICGDKHRESAESDESEDENENEGEDYVLFAAE